MRTEWTIQVERSRDFAGTMVPPTKRTRTNLKVMVPPFTTEEQVMLDLRLRKMVDPRMDRVLKIIQREVVR